MMAATVAGRALARRLAPDAGRAVPPRSVSFGGSSLAGRTMATLPSHTVRTRPNKTRYAPRSDTGHPGTIAPAFGFGLADVARHVIGCHLNEETGVQSAFDDVAWPAISVRPYPAHCPSPAPPNTQPLNCPPAPPPILVRSRRPQPPAAGRTRRAGACGRPCGGCWRSPDWTRGASPPRARWACSSRGTCSLPWASARPPPP